MSKIKDIFYNCIVRKNVLVKDEYERYVIEHIDEHNKKRFLHWKILCKLIIHYRFKKNTTPLLYSNKQSLQVCSPRSISKKNIKLPYLEGPESKLYNNKEAHYIAKDFLQYDVISFDIFDTLIFRPFAKPEDLFYIIGEKLNIDGFRKIRMNAEAEAREYALETKGNREVTIYDIYRIVNIYTGIDIEVGVQTELQIEVDLCFANPQMKRVFNLLKHQGKRIVLTSDMYLSSNMIKRLLDKCGIYGYERIFVSCEYQCSKRTGGLYKNVQEYVGEGTTLIHIGDNHETDFVKPKEYGIVSAFYKNVNKGGNMYRADGMSELIGSAYAGIVNAQLHNGIKKYSSYYEYGFVYGGLYIFGFCNWINEFVKQNNVDKIIFLSRDGNIYKKVYDSFFGDIQSEYVHWSRVANMKYAIDASYGKNYFMTRAVDDRVNEELQKKPLTISQLLQILHLSELEIYLDEDNLTPDMLIVKEISKLIKLFLHRHWDKIRGIYSKEEKVVKYMISQKIGGAKKVAIIDVGWNGSGPLGLKYLIENKWNLGCKVECLLAGSKVADHVANINRLENRDLHTYLFSRILNRDNYDIHRDSNKGLNSSFFEIFTQACEPSFCSITESGEFVFELPEIENYKMIVEIHSGIYDFCKIYHDTFLKYPYLYNISGYDAYRPFRMVVRDTKLIKNTMGDFVFARNVGNSINSFGFLKARDMFKQVGL